MALVGAALAIVYSLAMAKKKAIETAPSRAETAQREGWSRSLGALFLSFFALGGGCRARPSANDVADTDDKMAAGPNHPHDRARAATSAEVAPSASATASVAASPSSSAAPPSKTRVATEWGDYTWSIIAAPRDVDVRTLSSTGFVDPSTEDFGERRVGGFPSTASWGAPKTSDFAAKLSALLESDASYDFDVVTRCAPSKGVIGLVLRHAPICAPNDLCALDVVHVVVNFPCHQIFVTTRVQAPGGSRGKTWAAHFGPVKDKLLDLMAEGFPDKAALLKTLR